MTEPYTVTSKLPISDKYRLALDILNKYRINLINTNTLKGQSPKGVLEVSESIVREKGNQLIQGLRYPNSTPMDPDVKQIVQDLQPLFDDADPDVKTFVLDWADKMFNGFVFTLEPEHIENLRKKVTSLDGGDSQNKKEMS